MHYHIAVPVEAVNYYGSSFVNNPVGSGPYILINGKEFSIEFMKSKWVETNRKDYYPSFASSSQKTEDY